ncbi:MAG: hypothetical protein QOF72_1796, partial [Blastocatellia bacterium]|nr:hypothetical protein [Blastocatellia bacterium]
MSQFDLARRNHWLKVTNIINRFPIQRCVNLNHRHRFPAPLATPQMKRADVYALLTENCADPSNHARNIAIVHYE